uniref:LamG-like jellyroll fold domain-containing protein n=1 Tax=viral metagenome TaxID=1070528 RepID=A0A6C0KQJ1_9ZZZZ
MEFINNSTQNINSRMKSGGIVSEILYGITLCIVVYLVLLFVEVLYKYINRLSLNRTVLLANTYSTDNKTIVIPQSPNTVGSKVVQLSNDERSGIEFSYSFYLYVNPSSFRQEYGLLHIFHKGYSCQFPLLAPGVYMRSDTNTLRVYMNTYKTWNNYVEVDNIPVNKWVHIVLVCKNNAFEIFINGNLKKKLSFDGYAPYQNYQDIVCFSQRRLSLKRSIVPSVDENGFDVFGTMKGLLSDLNYFSYGLCYAEIQDLMNRGPSTKMGDDTNVSNIPPYLSDTWWTQGN